MKIEIAPLAAGLYFVATPIGAARDITLRALDILASVDVIAAEDTRTARHLMRIHGIVVGDRPIMAYHDHSGPAERDRILNHIAAGKSVAYVSEAGTPLLADPGYRLGRAVIAAGFTVTSAPGPSALLAALTVSGLPSDRVLFAGFAPTTRTARRAWITELAECQATLAIYESPKRINGLLGDLVNCLGEEREAAICRELTKKFEEVLRGSLAMLQQDLADRTLKGEIVVLVDRAPQAIADEDMMNKALARALMNNTVKDAAAEVAKALNLPKRQVYQAALKLERDG